MLPKYLPPKYSEKFDDLWFRIADGSANYAPALKMKENVASRRERGIKAHRMVIDLIEQFENAGEAPLKALVSAHTMVCLPR